MNQLPFWAPLHGFGPVRLPPPAIQVAVASGGSKAAGPPRSGESSDSYRGGLQGLPPAGRPPAPLAVRLSCSNGSPIAAPEVLRAGVATRLAVGPPEPEPTDATSPMRPSSSIMPSVLRGCVRAPPRAPRAGQGVRSPAAGADAVRGPRSASGSPGAHSPTWSGLDAGRRPRPGVAAGRWIERTAGGEIRRPAPEKTATPALGGVAQDSHRRFAGSRVPARRISCAVARDIRGLARVRLREGARSRQPCAGVNVSRSPGPSTYSAGATFGGQRSPRLKVTASKGRMRTGASSCAVAISTHSPSRSSKASRVRSAGSTSHR